MCAAGRSAGDRRGDASLIPNACDGPVMEKLDGINETFDQASSTDQHEDFIPISGLGLSQELQASVRIYLTKAIYENLIRFFLLLEWISKMQCRLVISVI